MNGKVRKGRCESMLKQAQEKRKTELHKNFLNCDILLEVPENRVGVVIEMKYAQEDRMEAACTEALKQIEQRQYAARLKSDGMKNIVNYGIACYRKHCKVKIGKENS